LHPLHVQPESPGDELVAMPLDPLNNINQATHISVALYFGAWCFSPKLRAGRKIHLHVDFSLDRFLLKQSCKFGCPLEKNGNNSRTTEVGKGFPHCCI
jgi:hypothetical protein